MEVSEEIRTEMFKKASRLTQTVDNEEAWQLISLFKETQPKPFLRICHRILASFLELTHDYFDEGWPITSQISSRPIHCGLSSLDLRRGKTKSLTTDTTIYDCDLEDSSLFNHYGKVRRRMISPNTGSPFLSCDAPTQSPKHSPKLQTQPCSQSKLRTITARRFFKQLLPSKPTSVSHNGEHKLAHPRSNEPVYARQYNAPPISPHPHLGTWIHPYTVAQLPSLSGIVPSDVDNLDSAICRCLMDYMLDTPDVYSTEGLFRIPGNSQRIRELWTQLCDYFRNPYIRLPQPEPDNQTNSVASPFDRLDVYAILGSYSPHDLASLMLRTMVTCCRSNRSSSTTKHTQRCFPTDETSSDSRNGLVPSGASQLCFLATRLQYALKDTENVLLEDWMPVLCEARQLLTYRIVFQLLLPSPERELLLGALQLFHRVAQSNATSRMSAECLARCAAVAVFGTPNGTNTPGQLSNTNPEDNPLRWRIDTLKNMINMAEQLRHLPALIHDAVRNRLQIRFGHSPVQRTPLNRLKMDKAYPQAGAVDSESPMRWRLKLQADESLIPQGISTTTEVMKSTKLPQTTRGTPSRVSIHRSVSTVNTNAYLKKLQTYNNNHTRSQTRIDLFQFWRRQKTPTIEQSQGAYVNRMSKVRSTTALKSNFRGKSGLAI